VAHLQCVILVIMSAGIRIPATGLEDGISMGWEGVQYLLKGK